MELRDIAVFDCHRSAAGTQPVTILTHVTFDGATGRASRVETTRVELFVRTGAPDPVDVAECVKTVFRGAAIDPFHGGSLDAAVAVPIDAYTLPSARPQRTAPAKNTSVCPPPTARPGEFCGQQGRWVWTRPDKRAYCCAYEDPCMVPEGFEGAFRTEAECTRPAGTECSPGQQISAGDGCNMRVCVDGRWGGVTLKSCRKLDMDGGRVDASAGTP